MPERVYRDMTPGLTDVPASTWADATVENVSAVLFEHTDLAEPETVSLRELLASQYIPPMTDAARELLTELAPDAIPLREEQIYMDWISRRRRGRRLMPHHQQFEDQFFSD